LLLAYFIASGWNLTLMIDFIKRVIVTQKSTTLLESERYTFDVDVQLKKTDIKALVEDLYGVQVLSVNTHRLPRKKAAFGGVRPRTKRAIIRLKSGDALPIFD
jgi:large subunit ribosomal protein L23